MLAPSIGSLLWACSARRPRRAGLRAARGRRCVAQEDRTAHDPGGLRRSRAPTPTMCHPMAALPIEPLVVARPVRGGVRWIKQGQGVTRRGWRRCCACSAPRRGEAARVGPPGSCAPAVQAGCGDPPPMALGTSEAAARPGQFAPAGSAGRCSWPGCDRRRRARRVPGEMSGQSWVQVLPFRPTPRTAARWGERGRCP